MSKTSSTSNKSNLHNSLDLRKFSLKKKEVFQLNTSEPTIYDDLEEEDEFSPDSVFRTKRKLPRSVNVPSKKVADMLLLCNCDYNKLMVCQHPERVQLKCTTLTCPVLIELSEDEFDPSQIL